MTAEAILQATELKLIMDHKEIFNIANLSIHEGEVTALVGPNGAGKTSLLLTLALLHRPSCGQIFFYGQPVSRQVLPLRRQMAVVFQEPLLMDTTVLGNVMTGLRIRGVNKSEALQRAEEWLQRLGIAQLAKRSALQLSGGEAQRVNLARAFALQPKILFMDEPFSALDYPTRSALLDDIGAILQETRITTLLVTHDYTEIPSLASRVLVMLGGHLIKDGTVAEILGTSALPPRIPVPWKY
jgi:tungstate transport system ATP-binding protein